MVVPHVLYFFLSSLLVLQAAGDDPALPEWTRAADEPNLFVVETEEYSTHLDVTNGLLPAVKASVSQWAVRSYGDDCKSVVESIPLEDFRDLIHENQEIVHESRRIYDAETAKRLEAEYDVYYRGYIRVHVNENFRDALSHDLRRHRLRNRLCKTLIGALLAIGLASIGWGYLFANRISRGFYISRIRWIAGTMLIVLILVCYSVYLILF